MTVMIYRPLTNESMVGRKDIVKTQSQSVKLDALIVDESDVESFCKKGWFGSLKEIMVPKEETKPKKARSND